MSENPARTFADELRKWWSFDDDQVHTHTWHSREDFIGQKLPELIEGHESIFVRALTEMAERSSAAMERAAADLASLRAQLSAARAEAEQAREKAIEECAKIADAYILFCDRDNAAASYKREAGRLIAQRLRALSATTPKESPDGQ